MDKATQAISLLMEGTSLRSVCRLIRIGQHTLLDLLLRVGEGCERLSRQTIRDVRCSSVQCDELWSFVHCKEKTRLRKYAHVEEVGDCYTWTGIDPKTKLILAYAVGKRDNVTGMEFIRNLRRATFGSF